MTVGPATLASGAALPALWAAFGEHRSAARPVGELTAANLLGGALGAIAAGFVVLPWIGPLRRLLVDPFQVLIANGFDMVGMKTLSAYWSPN